MRHLYAKEAHPPPKNPALRLPTFVPFSRVNCFCNLHAFNSRETFLKTEKMGAPRLKSQLICMASSRKTRQQFIMVGSGAHETHNVDDRVYASTSLNASRLHLSLLPSPLLFLFLLLIFFYTE